MTKELDITPAYEEICTIICNNESIATLEDLQDFLKAHHPDMVYTEDDLLTAYGWASQAIQRVIDVVFSD